jgi:DNA-binding NtrC family response regulator
VARILIVDDELSHLRILLSLLSGDGHQVTTAGGVVEARTALSAHLFDLVITDQKMPDGDGLSLLSHCREVDPALPVVFLSAFATVELAVEAMRLGAFDVVPKPFVPDQVRAVVRRATERTALVRENERLQGQVRRLAEEDELVGESPAMEEVRELIRRVAPTPATVLISGETGTGKELVARAVHAVSPRSAGPFIAVNCAALTESLLESELFGHEKGAFTGAERARPGVFEAADQGTLFLDEAGEMSLALQAKLLRVLVDGEILRVGSTVPRQVDVRVVVATHRDLAQRVRDGEFRQDLYYRLAVVPIAIPPLRQRREDVPPLIEHLLTRVSRDLKLPRRGITPGAVARLRAYDLPGNVRELRNLIERATILCRGETISEADLPHLDPTTVAGEGDDALLPRWIAGLPASLDLRDLLQEVEARLVRRALDEAGGVQAEAARRLGISRSDIGYKLKRLDVDAPADDD